MRLQNLKFLNRPVQFQLSSVNVFMDDEMCHSTRYTHAHLVPHAKHVGSSIERNYEAQSVVEITLCCPPPILLTGQRAK